MDAREARAVDDAQPCTRKSLPRNEILSMEGDVGSADGGAAQNLVGQLVRLCLQDHPGQTIGSGHGK